MNGRIGRLKPLTTPSGVAKSRRVALSLDPDLFEAVSIYRDSIGGEGNTGMNDAIRELLRVGLAMAPRDAAFMAQRAAVGNEMRSYAAQRLLGMLNELKMEIAERYGVTDPAEEQSHGG